MEMKNRHNNVLKLYHISVICLVNLEVLLHLPAFTIKKKLECVIFFKFFFLPCLSVILSLRPTFIQ